MNQFPSPGLGPDLFISSGSGRAVVYLCPSPPELGPPVLMASTTKPFNISSLSNTALPAPAAVVLSSVLMGRASEKKMTKQLTSMIIIARDLRLVDAAIVLFDQPSNDILNC